MQDNRNSQPCLSGDTRGMLCIDTKRILDACRDRDCFEDVRVYLTRCGEEILQQSTNIRTKSAKILWAYVGVSDIPFNTGFYQITVRYYIELTFEACVAIGRSQSFTGLAIVEKDVVLYGGEGNITSYSSSLTTGYCDFGNGSIVSNNLPTAVVETVEPVVLSTRVQECGCACSCNCCECIEIPECVRCCCNDSFVNSSDGLQILVSLGIFSVIRIERPAQILIQGTDYCVPDKECMQATNNDNPCDLFRTIAFPTSRFKGNMTPNIDVSPRGNGCGCQK